MALLFTAKLPSRRRCYATKLVFATTVSGIVIRGSGGNGDVRVQFISLLSFQLFHYSSFLILGFGIFLGYVILGFV